LIPILELETLVGTGGGSGEGLNTVNKSDGDSPYTSSAYEEVLCDVTSGPMTVNLPAAPNVGDRVAIKDESGNAGTNTITIGANGNDIEGQSGDDAIDIDYGRIEYVFDGNEWVRTVLYSSDLGAFPNSNNITFDPSTMSSLTATNVEDAILELETLINTPEGALLLDGRTGGQTVYGSDTTAESLTLKNNSVDDNTSVVLSDDLTLTANGTVKSNNLELGGSGATVDTIETTLTDDDTNIPTSGAVFDAIGAINEFDISPTPSDGNASGIIVTMQVDANSTGFAAALHMDTDGNWIEADADSTTTIPCGALALETGTGSKQVLMQGFITNSGWSWTVGGLIYVSTTTGGLTQTIPSGSGDQVQVVGYATTSTRMYFSPNLAISEVA
jgi:hypothetical protein